MLKIHIIVVVNDLCVDYDNLFKYKNIKMCAIFQLKNIMFFEN